MTTHVLVQAFYDRLWNAKEDSAASSLLAEEFTFRGSLGVSMQGRGPFLEYVRSIRGSLSSYRCEILDCVTESDRAFARMAFCGIHTGEFRGYPPTRKVVSWHGAALFTFRGGLILDLWVLGDLAGLDTVLRANAIA